MITEDYVSYEVAKLLKEKGFAERCHFFYPNSSSKLIFGDKVNYNNPKFKISHLVSAPTHQMACKWLREVHKIHVDVGYDDLDWFWNIISISEDVPIADRPKFIVTGTACHRTYEEAVEAAIKYVLENLM